MLLRILGKKLLRLLLLIPISFLGGYIFATPFAVGFTDFEFGINITYRAIYTFVGAYFVLGFVFFKLLPVMMAMIVGTFLTGLIYLRRAGKDGKVKSTKYGYAKFCSLQRIPKIGFSYKKGIVLGKKLGRLIRMDKPLSVLVLAPPSTGKTAGIIIPTLLSIKNSVIIYDLKGNLFAKTSKARSEFSDIFLFDPLDDNSCVFNLFAKGMLPRDGRDVRAYILNICSILFKAPREGDEYFINAAKSAFLFFAEWLVWKNGETSFGEIRDQLLENPNVISTIRKMIEDPHLPKEIVKDGNGVLISEDSERQWAGVVGVFKETIELFADERVRKATTGICDFTGEIARKNKISVYVKVRVKDSERLEPLIKLLFECLGNQLISELPEKREERVTFVLDEFTRLGRINVLRKLPEVSREYDVNTIFVAQDYEQIALTYSRETVDIFETNCAVKVVFNQNNLKTAERISRTIGNKTDTRRSKSEGSHNSNKSKSESQSQEGTPLLSPQDILNMRQKECIILMQAHLAEPIRAKICYFFEDKRFKKMVGEIDSNSLSYKSTIEKKNTTIIVKPLFEDDSEGGEVLAETKEAMPVRDEKQFQEEIILDLIKSESKLGNLYVPNIFAQKFEDRKGLKSKSLILDRISSLSTSGRILYSRDWSRYSLEKTSTKMGLMLISDMIYKNKEGEEMKVIATHFKHETTGSLTAIIDSEDVEPVEKKEDNIKEVLEEIDLTANNTSIENYEEFPDSEDEDNFLN